MDVTIYLNDMHMLHKNVLIVLVANMLVSSVWCLKTDPRKCSY